MIDFISKKLKLEENVKEFIQVSCRNHIIQPHHTLSTIKNWFWKAQEPVIVSYSFSKPQMDKVTTKQIKN